MNGNAIVEYEEKHWNELRKRFVMDNALPIDIEDDNYFQNSEEYWEYVHHDFSANYWGRVL